MEITKTKLDREDYIDVYGVQYIRKSNNQNNDIWWLKKHDGPGNFFTSVEKTKRLEKDYQKLLKSTK